MNPDIFRFKNFQLKHNQCAHKIGTDGVLLAAWVESNKPQNILDIGSGSGLISFMMKQRFPKASVLGIELDEPSFQQSIQNKGLNANLNVPEFIQGNFLNFEFGAKRFDLIISNPPFFKKAFLSGKNRRDRARHDFSLPHLELLNRAKQLLAPEGIIALILPVDEAMILLEKTPIEVKRISKVHNTPNAEIKRYLIEFKQNSPGVSESALSIRSEDGDYSNDYKTLTKDFYLNF